MKKERDFYQISLKVLLKNDKGEILALKAVNDGSYAGFYELPGGRIDTDEFATNFASIVAREILEEIGEIKFKLKDKPVAVGRGLIPSNMSSSGKPVRLLLLFFEAEYLSGEIKISDEHVGYKWLDLSKIKLDEYFISGILEGVKMYCVK